MKIEAPVEDALENAIQCIKESKVYLSYRKQLELVKQEPGLKEQIDNFRVRNFELQSSDDVSMEKIEAFEREFENFRSNPLVADFLAAELAFCRMIQQLQQRIVDEMEFE